MIIITKKFSPILLEITTELDLIQFKEIATTYLKYKEGKFGYRLPLGKYNNFQHDDSYNLAKKIIDL